MKKLLLISILLGSVILAGCGQQQWVSQNQLFEKKQECAKYKDEVTKELIHDYVDPWLLKVNDVFYSPKLNTCLYRVWYYKDVIEEWYFNDLISERLFDYFSNKDVATSYDWKWWDNPDFEKEVQELKWE